MKDAKGNDLKVGDNVLVNATITHLAPGRCNVAIETLHGPVTIVLNESANKNHVHRDDSAQPSA